MCIIHSLYIRNPLHFQALPPDSTPIPSTTIFYLEKKGDFANITELYLGAKVHFLLGVHFPVGLTDVTIELFTPDNLDSSTSVMVLCGPKVSHVGGNLVLGVAEVTPLMDASRNDYNVSRNTERPGGGTLNTLALYHP